jgi:hypothetical protein
MTEYSKRAPGFPFLKVPKPAASKIIFKNHLWRKVNVIADSDTFTRARRMEHLKKFRAEP